MLLGGLTFGLNADRRPFGNDMLGLTSGKRPRFVRDFTRVPGSAADAPGLGIAQAVAAYVAAVKDASFPDEAIHGY